MKKSNLKKMKSGVLVIFLMYCSFSFLFFFVITPPTSRVFLFSLSLRHFFDSFSSTRNTNEETVFGSYFNARIDERVEEKREEMERRASETHFNNFFYDGRQEAISNTASFKLGAKYKKYDIYIYINIYKYNI